MAAAVTERVKLGTAVVLPPLHMPLRLAKSFATIDAASGGRLVAGLGSGWSVDEFNAIAPRPLKERGAALEEFLDIADASWGPDPVNVIGKRLAILVFEIAARYIRAGKLRHYPSSGAHSSFKARYSPQCRGEQKKITLSLS
jgi:alkanesulfonate monooxygenase SsuD/methylene tetrahydromethanopterin reductase-like flavin-dependent oxidoreductase (luciferase family)